MGHAILARGLRAGGKSLWRDVAKQWGMVMGYDRAGGAGLMMVVIAAMLSGCAAPAPEVSGYRNPDQTIASAALFDAGRFAGTWHVVAAYAPETHCGPLLETWVPTQVAGQFRVGGSTCRPEGLRGMDRLAEVTTFGRIRRHGPNGDEALWVLWVDADYRVAVIGTPDGSFGRILSREPQVRADLLASAREIMAFNGYDISRLQMLK